jgi:hypothetical protein
MKRVLRPLLVSLAASTLFSACQGPGNTGASLPAPRPLLSVPRPFPIGIFSPGDATNLPVLRAAGFNLVAGSPTAAFLDAAWSNHLAVLTTPPALPADLRRLDRHPALWGWLLQDEPEMARVPPARVLEAHQWVKGNGAKKPTALILFHGHAALDYANLADITACDRYPVPWLPLCSFGQNLRMVRLALGKEKPLLAIIQAFDWQHAASSLPDADPASLRPPTFEEMRCMTYLALVHQANGLMYYAYDGGPRGWRMADHPETWAGLCRVVSEVYARLPLFQAEQTWWAREQRWQEPSRRLNAALESSVDSVLLTVKEGTAAVPLGQYILAVNNTPQAQTYSFTPPGPALSKAAAETPNPLPVVGEERAVAVQNGWVKDEFAPYAVHVYGPLGK